MLVGLLATVLVTPALAPVPSERPLTLRLFEGDPRYLAAGGVETTFEGTLERQPGQAPVYRLVGREGGERVLWQLTLPDGPDRLADLVGRRVRVVGKLSGPTMPTLWPARMEPLGTLARVPIDGVLARSFWQPSEARQIGVRQFVFRDPNRLARALGLAGTDIDQSATATLSRLLGVGGIDWERQMLVTVCAGLRGDFDRLRVLRVERKGDTLTVFYKMEKSEPPSGGFGYPAETVLVDRLDGPVRFVDETVRNPARAPSP
jgi:hypothetical protein